MSDYHNVPYPLCPHYEASRKHLQDAASTYFIRQIHMSKRLGRVPDNKSVFTWVNKFMEYHIRMNNIPIGRLAHDIVPLTDVLWDIAIYELMSYMEEMSP